MFICLEFVLCAVHERCISRQKLEDSKQHAGPGLFHCFLVPSVLCYPDSKTLSNESSILLALCIKNKKKERKKNCLMLTAESSVHFYLAVLGLDCDMWALHWIMRDKAFTAAHRFSSCGPSHGLLKVSNTGASCGVDLVALWHMRS